MCPADEPTPYVAIDRSRLKRNITSMQGRANRHGVALRPHVKTHKCIEIARLQIAEGAVGLTASKPEEAMVFLDAGFDSITLAYPVFDAARLDRLIGAAKRSAAELSFIADSPTTVYALKAAANRNDARLRVFQKVDVGLGRVGVLPGSDRQRQVALAIGEAEGLLFAGLLSHAGTCYGASDPDEVSRIGRQEASLLEKSTDLLQRTTGMGVPAVSVGATPTALADAIFPPTTEIRPGNYVFSDLTQLRIGVATLEDVALSVVTTIVSVNDRHYIIDAGSKVLSSDLGPHGTGGPDLDYGMALLDGARGEGAALAVTGLSEEHGFVERAGSELPVGTRLRVYPRHACPVANLSDWYVVEEAGEIVDRWPIAARGKVR